MKRILLYAAILAFTLSTVTFSQPKLFIEGGDTYNWGRVKQTDGPLKAEVKLWNKGTDTLLITRVRPGCGCTTAPLDKDKVAPDDFATLNITLNIAHYKGSIGKSISIGTNDPENENKVYFIRCDIYQPISFNPNFVNFENMIQNSETASNITVINSTNEEIKITEIKTEPADVVVSCKNGDVIPANGEYEVKVVAKSSQTGPYLGRV